MQRVESQKDSRENSSPLFKRVFLEEDCGVSYVTIQKAIHERQCLPHSVLLFFPSWFLILPTPVCPTLSSKKPFSSFLKRNFSKIPRHRLHFHVIRR